MSAETVTIGGITIPLGDNRVLRARFEKYLNQPEEDSEAARDYRNTIREILAMMSPYHPGGPDPFGAFRLLPRAAAYPGDAGICSSLAEAIYVSMLARKDVTSLKRINAEIEKEKKDLIRKGDWKTRHDKGPNIQGSGQRPAAGGGRRGSRGGNNNRNATPMTGYGAQSLDYAEALRRIAEIEALKKTNIVRTEAQTLQAKVQYQVNMVQWFVERRFEHVLMAARFYNQIWRDGDTTLHIDPNSDVAKLFTQSVGVSPTVASLDSLANEAIREADKAIEAFDFLLENDEVHTASQRLMEAFALGEYLEPLATLPRTKKRRVALYMRDLGDLYGALQARDYTRAKELADKIKKNAKDFPSAKVDSAIAAHTLASDMAIENAKALLIAKNTEKAAEEIKAAAELWPTNPKLQEFRSLISSTSAVASLVNDFDRLLSEKNFREIFRRQYEFAQIVRDDPGRQEAFQQIISNITRIEATLGKASGLVKMGQEYAAWEQLAKLREEFPDDPKLGREMERLTPNVADFTKALDRARQFEQREPKQIGSALAWYLKARAIFQNSTLARGGIKRMVEEIIPEDNPDEKSSTPASAEDALPDYGL
jgi:3-methyladenine DNA glycosylase Tag